MNIEFERDTGVSKLTYAIERFQSACHPDLEDLLAEGAYIGNDIDMTCASLLRHGKRTLILLLSSLQLFLQQSQTRFKFLTFCSGCSRYLLLGFLERFAKVGFFFGCILDSPLILAASFLFFPDLLTQLTLLFSLLVFEQFRRDSPAQLLQARPKVFIGYPGVAEWRAI
ncbi:hypothetical protein D3C76_1402440 [compost metagenome]